MGRGLKPGMDWQACRSQWEAGLSSKRLCKLYPVTRQAIDQMATKEGWNRSKVIPNKLPAVAGFDDMLANTTASPETIAIILHSFECGNSQNVVAAISGFSHTTIANWRREYPEFDSAVRKAQGQHASDLVNHIKSASPRDWRAADRLLQVHELTKAEHLPQGQNPGDTKVNVVININRPAIDGDTATVIEHE